MTQTSFLSWSAYKLGHPRLVEYVDVEVVSGLTAVLQPIDVLTCERPHQKFTGFSVGQFADLLNVGFRYLA